MFSLSPGSGGTQGRRGRAAGPEAEPPKITSAEVARVRASAASDRVGRTVVRGAGSATGPS